MGKLSVEQTQFAASSANFFLLFIGCLFFVAVFMKMF